MDAKLEQKFVKTFIDKQAQDRFLFELSKKEKRGDALSKFAHTAERYIKAQYIYLRDSKLNANDIEKEIKKLMPTTQNCYVIIESHDGEMMTLNNALRKCFDSFTESIIIVHENLAFVKTETEYGASTKYILHKKN